MNPRVLIVAAVVIAAACGGKPPAEAPAPQPVVDSTAIKERMRADSIAAAERARAEAEARARADADARARAEAARAQVLSEVSAMVHFDYDRADIRPEDAAILDRKAAVLAANPGLRLRLSGHADSRGSDEYNLALGNRRAAAAKRYLENKGIEGSRLDIVSFGEERPLDPGENEAAWAQNRRAEFEITAGGDNLVAPQ